MTRARTPASHPRRGAHPAAIRRLRALLLALALLAPAAASAAPAGQADGGGRAPAEAPDVRTARVDGPITALTFDYINRTLSIAEQAGADAYLIELDTPGGELSNTLRITGRLLNAQVPTVVWVGPQGAQAASAGTFVVLAAHAAGMAPKTTIGAASPVGPGGEDLPDTIFRKITEDMSATARNYAARRGDEAAAWAEDAVRDAASATADEALDLGVVDAVADDPTALLDALDGLEVEVAGETAALETAGATLTALPMTPAEGLLARLAQPALALLLLTLGVNAILIELSNPGGFVAGIVGVLALALGFYSLGLLEANWIGLVFWAAAFGLFALEVKTPTLGLLTVAGVGLLIVGSVILFSGGGLAIPWVPILTLAAATGLFFFVVVGAAIRTLRKPPTTGFEGLIGQRAEVRTALAPAGTVLVAGERWDARLTGEAAGEVAIGERVRIVGRDGYTLRVAPIVEDNGPAQG